MVCLCALSAFRSTNARQPVTRPARSEPADATGSATLPPAARAERRVGERGGTRLSVVWVSRGGGSFWFYGCRDTGAPCASARQTRPGGAGECEAIQAELDARLVPVVH